MKGFTLIELLVSLSIVSILLLMTVLSTQPLNKKNKLEVIRDEIRQTIQYAKIKSTISGKELLLTPVSDDKTWSEGLRLSEINGTVIREWHWYSKDINVIWQGFQSKNYLLFSPDLNSNRLNGTFIVSDKAQNFYKLVVNRLGAMRNIIR